MVIICSVFNSTSESTTEYTVVEVEIDDEVCGVSVVVDEVNTVVDIVVEVVDFGPEDETVDVAAIVEGLEVVLFVARRSRINYFFSLHLLAT